MPWAACHEIGWTGLSHRAHGRHADRDGTARGQGLELRHMVGALHRRHGIDGRRTGVRRRRLGCRERQQIGHELGVVQISRDGGGGRLRARQRERLAHRLGECGGGAFAGPQTEELVAEDLERVLRERGWRRRRHDERLDRMRRLRPRHVAERVEGDGPLGHRGGRVIDGRDDVGHRRLRPELPQELSEQGLVNSRLQPRVQRILAPAGRDAERFEIPAVLAVVLRGERRHGVEPRRRRLLLLGVGEGGQHAGMILQHQRDLAPDLRG